MSMTSSTYTQPATIKEEEQRHMLPYHDMRSQTGSNELSFGQAPQMTLPYSHFAIMFINNRGELQAETSASIAGHENTIFTEEVQDRFLRLTNGDWQSGILSNPSAPSWYNPTVHRTSGLIPCEWQSSQSKRHRRNLRRPDSDLGHGWQAPSGSPLKRSTLRVGQTKLLRAYYEKGFDCFQQLNCRVIAKAFVKFVEPRKQVNYPYNGKRGPEGNDPEKTKPKWWPAGVKHKEPDHLAKPERLRLLVHILCELRESHGVTAEKLKDAGQDVRRQISPAVRLQVLDEIFYVRAMEELYLEGKISGDTTVHVSHVNLEDELRGLTISDSMHDPLLTSRDQEPTRRSYRNIPIISEDTYYQPVRNGKRSADSDNYQLMSPSPSSSVSRKSSLERSMSGYSSDIDPAILTGPEPARSPGIPQGLHPTGSTSLPDLFANQFGPQPVGQTTQPGFWGALAAPSVHPPFSFPGY